MKYSLCINEFAFFNFKFHAGPIKFLHQHGKVKFIAVESAKITFLQKLAEFCSQYFESGFIRYIFIANTMHRGGLRGDGNAGIYAVSAQFFVAFGKNLDHAYFYNSVCRGIDAGSFKIKNNQGAFECKFHEYGQMPSLLGVQLFK